jgi:hypothetical protein
MIARNQATGTRSGQRRAAVGIDLPAVGLSGCGAGDTLDLSVTPPADILGVQDMVERRRELDQRYKRKAKMRKLKAKLSTASGPDREKILYKIKRLSPWWTEAALTQGTTTAAAAPAADAPPKAEEPKKKAPPKKKPEPKA